MNKLASQKHLTGKCSLGKSLGTSRATWHVPQQVVKMTKTYLPDTHRHTGHSLMVDSQELPRSHTQTHTHTVRLFKGSLLFIGDISYKLNICQSVATSMTSWPELLAAEKEWPQRSPAYLSPTPILTLFSLYFFLETCSQFSGLLCFCRSCYVSRIVLSTCILLISFKDDI